MLAKYFTRKVKIQPKIKYRVGKIRSTVVIMENNTILNCKNIQGPKKQLFV